MLADMRGLGGRVGQRDGHCESLPSLRLAPELKKQRPLQAEEVEIAAEPWGKRLDHRESRLRSAGLGDGDGAIESNDRRRLEALERPVEEVDLLPIRILRL